MLKLIGSRLLARDQLPSVRQLASQAGVSVWTVNEAYQWLVARDVITSRPGAGLLSLAENLRFNVARATDPKLLSFIQHPVR